MKSERQDLRGRAGPHGLLGRIPPSGPTTLFIAICATMTALRIFALFYSDLNLGPDETQYWYWSRTPAFGYYSKPPMIAWLIAATTGVFGDSAWAIRLSAPLLHSATAGVLFMLGRFLFDARMGAWVGTAWLFLPGVMLSSALIATDGPLLLAWVCALYLFFASTAENRPHTLMAACGLGAAIGFGLLSKYAMIYFVIGMALAFFLTGRRLKRRQATLAFVTAAAISAPHWIWSAAHDFQTVSHTAANANWRGGAFLNLDSLGGFLAGQFAVFGPISFSMLLVGFAVGWRSLWRARAGLRRRAAAMQTELALACFAVPPLAIISVQAVLSRAHANWAATAYPAALLLVTRWALQRRRTAWLGASLGLHSAAFALFTLGVMNISVIDALDLGAVAKRVRGWPAHGAAIIAEVEAAQNDNAPYAGLLADDRELIGGVAYYARAADLPVYAWNSNNRVEHHFEAFHALDKTTEQRLLYVTERDDALAVQNRFEVIDLKAMSPGGAYGRTLYLFALSQRITENNP